jgi:DNA-binding response OmpR family regulator
LGEGERIVPVGLHWSPTGTQNLVLIVDDEPHIVLSLEFLLQRAGYETAAAADGEQGLALVRRLKPSVVLLDVMLPKLNGYEICQAIKSDPDTRATPVIMLSAKGQQVEILKGLELGAEAYVTKPFGNAEILDAIRAVIEPRP